MRVSWCKSLIVLGVCLLMICTSFPSGSSTTVHPATLHDLAGIGEIIQKINETNLTNYVSAIQGFGPHPTGSSTVSQLGQYLISQLLLTGMPVEQVPWRSKLRHGTNIIATLRGEGTEGDILVLCAHYDSVWVSPGADDDGSGVAAVLAAAKALCTYRFNCTIRFVFFSGEEQGLLGSAVYAKQARRLHERIIGVIALDGIGFSNASQCSHLVWNKVDAGAAWMVGHAQAVAGAFPELIPLSVFPGVNLGDSDHQSFIDQGYAGECFREEVLDPYYHSSEDQIKYMDLTYLTDVCRLATGTIASLAGLNRRLTSDQLVLHLRGSVSERHTMGSLEVENLGANRDSANLSVQFRVLNWKTGQVVRTPRNFSLNWTVTAEVRDSWVFKVGPQKLANQRVIVSATVIGQRDDEGLYQHLERPGVILDHRFLILF